MKCYPLVGKHTRAKSIAGASAAGADAFQLDYGGPHSEVSPHGRCCKPLTENALVLADAEKGGGSEDLHPPARSSWGMAGDGAGDRPLAGHDQPRVDGAGSRRRSLASGPGPEARRGTRTGDRLPAHIAAGPRGARRADGAGRSRRAAPSYREGDVGPHYFAEGPSAPMVSCASFQRLAERTRSQDFERSSATVTASPKSSKR